MSEPNNLKRRSREMAGLNPQNILEESIKVEEKKKTPAEVKMSLLEIIEQRKLAKINQANNMDSLKIPAAVA